MSDSYFDLPSRMEDAFSEIDSDIIVDLRKSNEEYAKLHDQISNLKQQHPFIDRLIEGNEAMQLTAEEHAVFAKCMRLQRQLEDMERLQIYFRGHTDAVAYLKRIGAI